MNEGYEKRRVLCLAGPTGAGKTALAIRLANTLGCEIVNADSRQVYEDFPIIRYQVFVVLFICSHIIKQLLVLRIQTLGISDLHIGSSRKPPYMLALPRLARIFSMSMRMSAPLGAEWSVEQRQPFHCFLYSSHSTRNI